MHFLPPHNPRNYPPTMGTDQEQVLVSERFRQNQALFRRCTAVERTIKNHIITAVKLVFLYPLVDYLTGFGQVNALQILQHLLNSCESIEKFTSRKTR